MVDRIELGPLTDVPPDQDADRFFHLLEVFARMDAGAAGQYLTDLLAADPRILTTIRQYVQDDVRGLIAGLVYRIDDHLPDGYSFVAEQDPTGLQSVRYAIRPDPAVFEDTEELVGVLTLAQHTDTARVKILVDALHRAFVAGEGQTDLSAVHEAIQLLLDLGFVGTLRLVGEPHGEAVFTANLGLMADKKPGVTAWSGTGIAAGAHAGARHG